MKMNITGIAFISAGIMASALIFSPCSSMAQKVNLTLKDQPMPSALKSIERAGGKDIIFSYGDLDTYRVTANIRQKTEAEAIKTVISGFPLTMLERERYFVVQRNGNAGSMVEINGRVTDDGGNPLSYCTVLMLRCDSTVIDGCTTNHQGWFHITGNYHPASVKVSFIGYKSKVVPYKEGRPHLITLNPDQIVLKGVTVTNEKPLASATDRGIMSNVLGTPLAKMGSASEMIRHLPLVMSDGTVVGHGTPEIYINSKKVRDVAELDRLRADEILTAEVITLPGVEYGANVTSVIRLKTVRRRGEGLSGSMSAAYRQGNRSYNSQNVALNYRTHNGIDFFVRGYCTEANSLINATSNDQLQASSFWDFRRNNKWKYSNNYYFADFGSNWDINEHHSVGVTYTAFNYIGDGLKRTESDEETSCDGAFHEHLQSSSETRTKPHMTHSVNAYYVGEINKWNIDFSTDYYNARSLSDMTAMIGDMIYAISSTETKNQLFAEKLTVSAPVSKGNLTFGEETSYVDRTSSFKQDGFSADNDTRQRTMMWSVFASYSLTAGKFSLTAGLRWQNEHNRYDIDGKRNAEMSPDYSILLPRLSVTYTDNGIKNTLAYTVSRYNPPYGLLSSAVNYRSKYEYDTGNPLLKPQTSYNISYTFSWKWIYLQPYYKYTENAIRSFQYAYDDVNHPGVMIMDYRNTPKTHEYGITLNMSPQIGLWQMDYTAEFGFCDQGVEALGITYKWNDLCTSFELDNSFSLPHDWMLNITGSVVPYARSGASKVKTTGQIDFRLNKSFFKNNALNLAIVAKDIFKTAYREMTAYGGINVSTKFREYRDVRRFGIELSYKFNTTNSRYKGSHAGQSERNRL